MSSYKLNFFGALPLALLDKFLEAVDGVRLMQSLMTVTGRNFATDLEEVEAEAKHNGGRRKGARKFLDVTRGKITTDELVKALRAEGYDELADKICALIGRPITGAAAAVTAAAAAIFPAAVAPHQSGQQQPVVQQLTITHNYAPISVQHGNVNNVENNQRPNSGDEDTDEEQEVFVVAVDSNGSSISADNAPGPPAGDHNPEISSQLYSRFGKEVNIGDNKFSGFSGPGLMLSPGNQAAADHFHEKPVDHSPELAVRKLGVELRIGDLQSEELSADVEETDPKVVQTPENLDGEITLLKPSVIYETPEPCVTSADLPSVADTSPLADSDLQNLSLNLMSDAGHLAAFTGNKPASAYGFTENASAASSNMMSLMIDPAAFTADNRDVQPAEQVDGSENDESLEMSEVVDDGQERNEWSSTSVASEPVPVERIGETSSDTDLVDNDIPDTVDSSSQVQSSSSGGTDEHSLDRVRSSRSADSHERTPIDNLQNETT